ncbi:hypothetical protein X560_2577 [Listeria fleischmannii 1991]|uniref:Uncharacterized protein n=1 Tax=Listeria fleischmannii 1991 TaxID=1430899 RepID=A0A0J8GAN4_9LIST|nr:hypothetical protein X560_2577 [Listeria fleischmannii 1991]
MLELAPSLEKVRLPGVNGPVPQPLSIRELDYKNLLRKNIPIFGAVVNAFLIFFISGLDKIARKL